MFRALAVARQAAASPAAPVAQPAVAAHASGGANAAADDNDNDDEDSDEDDSDDDMSALAPNERLSEEDTALAAKLEAAFASDDDMGRAAAQDVDVPFVDAARIKGDKAVTEAALTAMRVLYAERKARKAALAGLAMEAEAGRFEAGHAWRRRRRMGCGAGATARMQSHGTSARAWTRASTSWSIARRRARG